MHAAGRQDTLDASLPVARAGAVFRSPPQNVRPCLLYWREVCQMAEAPCSLGIAPAHHPHGPGRGPLQIRFGSFGFLHLRYANLCGARLLPRRA